MLTSAMGGVLSVDALRFADREPADAVAGECGYGVGEGRGCGRHGDLADPRRWLVRIDQVDFDVRNGLDAHDGVAVEVLGDDVTAFTEDDLAPGRCAEPPEDAAFDLGPDQIGVD